MVQRATTIQTAAICDLLRQYCEKAEGGLARYRDTWSDEKIAQHIGCSIHSVARYRTSVYGDLRRRPRASTYATRVEACEQQIENLFAWTDKIEAWGKKHDANIKEMANQVHELRHGVGAAESGVALHDDQIGAVRGTVEAIKTTMARVDEQLGDLVKWEKGRGYAGLATPGRIHRAPDGTVPFAKS